MITVDIVTPQRKLVEGVKVSSLRLPSVKGELTILPGHAELLTLLDTGVMRFAQDGGERKFVVSYGFAEVRNDRVIVMADTCEEAAEIDRQRAIAAQKKAEEQLSGTLSDEDYRKYQWKLRRSIIRQTV